MHMTEAPQPGQPTTVVGYPQSPQPSQGSANPGMASLRSQVSVVRYLVIASIAMLVVIAVALGVALTSTKAQLDDLSAQVSALSDQAAQQQATSQQPQAQQPQAQEQTQQQGTPQLGASPELVADVVTPAGADRTGAILIGDADAADVVEVYVDYQCPFCQKWEAEIGSVLAERAQQPGSGLLVKQYNLAFLGEASPDLSPAGASARAASAAACVLESDGVPAFTAFNALVFQAADPSEPPSQFSAEQLTTLAGQAGASAAAAECIAAETHVPFVAATTQAGFGRGVGGTPTVLVNGRTVDNPFTDTELLTLGSES